MLENFTAELNKEDLNILKDRLQKAQSILIFTHQNPDTDAIGSTMALARHLSHEGKEYKIFLPKPLIERFFYLKEQAVIINEKELERETPDLIVGLDCSNLDWSGAEEIFKQKKAAGIFFINIDHHPNSSYADINIVDKGRPSTSLILYNIFKVWGTTIDDKMATQILAGVVADTNGFINGATNTEAYLAAGELMERGARYNYIMKKFEKNDHSSWFRLWSRLLSRLTRNDKIKLAYSVVLPEDVEDGEAAVLDGATNFLSNLSEMRMAMILKEDKDGEIRVSMRSIDGQINVAEIANWFGGGGHVKSAGFAIRGRLEREGNYWQIV
ncbi:MAG TPA: DHH family phosphoesterase [Patescibacteria group bacterium]|nr:DHH family phosphoesterase [Patescibacteria group bacterium]